ncbi:MULTISPECIES: GNAT family N-acetyltransferase [unclassified Polaromonas]|uniref:GNAT family N-acetyltransferase n=4 Tax=Polaromonas TaxID=52972 RepID=UPI000BC8FA09|nr:MULTISPECIES: GNAT family N-acetyltransferase [unclassified Polaromonas]OYY36978.1 MAG: GNAT family N-acetyltransferase [Polaromonas sp. 35-63-35]OYZ20598.1 MAG: GNAT family N-acetyltransferase [Polaromonas sp. 16-63-31]OYZ78738.1 MAG: GNAT family N-acetyltransferase [Polaromonas sp. 24-63-21]OZA49750.1 MAG: GNAT family N-acetyltransferase [Polaromonas sp. 17-63-33]OZA89081.1 MAG: GNAT family N-acetyltransferase [Polaromonas sp. 39-63-25]
MTENDYVIRVLDSPLQVQAADWNALLAAQPGDGSLNPFMRHEYLAAMLESGSATPQTGWTARFVTLSLGTQLVGACALYLKDHSYGEYVFDHAWANAYHQHGLPYYPKALVAPPFTPVPGPRLLARDAATRTLLVQALLAWCAEEGLSSLHLLFASDEDVAACEEAGLMLRHNVQFHWTNRAPTLGTDVSSLPPGGALRLRTGEAGSAAPAGEDKAPTLVASRTALPPEGALRLRTGEAGSAAPAGEYGEPRPFRDFDDFLMSLSQEKRKKIRQERRKVLEAGVRFRWSLGKGISTADWDFFYRCYERTYYEHGNAPYLSRDFFQRMQDTMPENWLLFVAERDGRPIATSLIAVSAGGTRAGGQFNSITSTRVAYGRYWGALERVDCLHFEACYYQPLQWCMEHGYQRFEGGAQGEHKMARALLPVKTTSAHWLAHPAFADAVERFLEREGEGMAGYMEELERRNPFRQIEPGGNAPS